MAQTKDGSLWVATDQALFWFDGVRFTRLEALSKSHIRCLLATRGGSLWVVFNSGRVSRLSERKHHYLSARGTPEDKRARRGPGRFDSRRAIAGVAALTVLLGTLLLIYAAVATVAAFQVLPAEGRGWFLLDAVASLLMGILILARCLALQFFWRDRHAC